MTKFGGLASKYEETAVTEFNGGTFYDRIAFEHGKDFNQINIRLLNFLSTYDKHVLYRIFSFIFIKIDIILVPEMMWGINSTWYTIEIKKEILTYLWNDLCHIQTWFKFYQL